MADAPEIKVKLTAEDTGVAAAIKELGANLKNLKTQQDATTGSTIKMGEAFKGLLAAIAVEKFAEFGKATLESATAIARASQITGASTQTLGVFRKTADDLGVSVRRSIRVSSNSPGPSSNFSKAARRPRKLFSCSGSRRRTSPI